MITYDKRCKVCQIITLEGKDKSPLLKRIYDSRQFLPDGEALTEILADYQADLKYLSLYNHSRKHQSLSEAEVAEKKITKLENKVQTERLNKLISTSDFRTALKDKAMAKLEADEVKGFTVASIAKLLKDEDDVAAKQKDQQIKVLGMIEGFQSGAVTLPESAEIIEVHDFAVLPEGQ